MRVKKTQFSFISTSDGFKKAKSNSWNSPNSNNFFNPNPEPKMPWYFSSEFIVIMFFLFFPVSLILLAKRANLTNNSKKAGRGLKKAGILVFMLGVFGVILGLTVADYGANDFLAIIVTFIFGGSGMFRLGVGRARRAKRYRSYIELIVNKGITSIDDIAVTMSINYENVVKDIKDMIAIGYFQDVYIDESKRKIILPGIYMENYEELNNNLNELFNNVFNGKSRVKQPEDKQPEIKQTQAKKESEFVVINCKGCGANNKIKRYTVGECEFCGSHIGED